MSRWNIYHKDGTKLTDVNDDEVVVHGLQYSDKWMGDCFLTVDFKNNAPINFKIGDYIIYRGERFELNYEPGKDKKASLNTYGEGFVYDSVKFNALQDELSRSEFLDVVLNDNELHYTSLPKFSFYVESLDDLLDRIQANLDEQIGKGVWKVYSRSKKRSLQRGCSDADWTNVYGGGTPKNVIESKSITVDGKTCWEALALVNSEWDINFIVRGRNVYVGTAGVLAKNIFKYGLGKGLSELIQNADSEQQIVTRLRAYGSEKNLPSHYYADLGVKYFCNITEVNTATSYLSVYIDMEYIDNYFTIPRVFVPNDGTGKEQTYGYVLKVTFDFQTVITCVVTALSSGQAVMLYSEVKNNMEDNGDEPSKENLDRFIAQVNAGNRKLYITGGLNTKAVPSSMKEYAQNLPNNMSINRLMLPGFPHVSLNDYYNSLSKADKEYVNPTGKEHVFSTNPHRPYIDSVNIQQIGLRSASQYFDNDDKTNGIVEIYPTIEEMVVGGVRVDEIDEGVAPNDNGRFEDGQTVNNVDIYLNPSIDFDINDLKDSDFSIAMKDGMCGGRTFKVASSVKENGRWRLTIQRVKDDALELWFPYKDYPIRKGDHFVLTGITLPDSYVNAASLKLLKYAIAYIDKNDYTRYVYQPKVDEVFMARQNDQATEDKTGTIKSLHDTLKAGDIMEFDDDDLHIGGKVTIDQLVIRENEGGIPTYEVTLRNDVEVGTMAKIKQQISSLESGNGKVSSETSKQITDSTINEASKHFLSKLKDDTAQGVITFIKGLVSEALVKLNGGAYFGKGGALIDEAGRAILESLQSIDYDNAAEQGFAVKKENEKYHAFVTNLTIWGKAIFNQLEVRKLSYAGGNVYLSGAGSKIVKVVPVIWESESSEWMETSVDKCEGWLCYLLADDGTTATQNLWREGDQVRCKTIGTLATGTTNASNKSYWRTIPEHGVSSVNEKIYDKFGNELYGGQMFSWIVIGKHSLSLDSMTEELATAEIGGIPEAGDTIVLDGHRAVYVGGQIVDDYSRKGVLILESTGENTPRIVGFKGVNGYSHAGKEVFVLSPDGSRFYSNLFEWVSPSGDTMHMVNYRGEWKAGSYDYYDQVNHNNALWTCINENGTSQEPSDASEDWQKVLSGEKGDKGDKGEDGTSVTINGQAEGHYANFAALKADASNLTQQKGTVLLDKSSDYSGGFATPSTIDYTKTSNGSVAWSNVKKANIGDCYILSTTKEIYSNSDGTAWKNLGNIQGPKGDKGDKGENGATGPQGNPGADGAKGEDGVSILIAQPIVLDTDDDGIVSDTSRVTAEGRVMVMRGGENVTNECSDVKVSYMLNCTATASKETRYIKVKLNSVNTTTLESGDKVSMSEGYVTVAFSLGGKSYAAQVPFSENVTKYMGSVKATAKQYQSQFKALENDLKGSNPTVLKAYTSTIKQAAREISLSVSEKSIGRRNLLVGSAFLREDNNCILSNDAKIEINSGYQGTNCIHVIDETEAGTTHYVGAYWDGSQGGRSIKIEKGKKYTMSCFYKTNDINAEFYLEAIYTDKQENATRKGQAKYLSPNKHTVKKVNEWELFTTVVDTTDAEYDYIAFNFWEACIVIAGQINAWICRPMVEEGDTYNGWTLSQNDYDIIGANLIDNSRTLDTGGNVFEAKGQKTLVGDAYELTYRGSDDYNQFYRIDSSKFKLDTDYTLSFECRGDANYLCVNAFYPITNTQFAYYAESKNGTMLEGKGDGKTNEYGILMEITELSKQQKVWCHFRFKDRLPAQIYFQFKSNTEQAGVTSWNVTITKPKIEVGAVVTEYTEKKTDLIDKSTAKAAGLNITADGVELYGDKVKVKNNGKTAAMFTDGKLNADLIDADTINVHHVWAKDGNNQNTLAHFGNYDIDEAKDEDGKQYPLWVGSSTASNALFKVSKEGYMYAKSGKIAGFDIIDNYLHASNKTAYTEETRFLSMYEEGMIFSEKIGQYYRQAAIGSTANAAPSTHRLLNLSDETADTLEKIGAYVNLKNCLSNSVFAYLYGIYVNVEHEKNKFAMYAKSGRIVTNDWMAGLRYSVLNVNKVNTIYAGYLDLSENNVWFIKSTAGSSHVLLPTLSNLKEAIGMKSERPSTFRLKLTIIGHVKTTDGVVIRGRTARIGSNTSYNTKEYPLFLDYDGGQNYWALSRGDVMEVMLYYDGTDYYAQLLTLSR